jgi:hypothetical protein
VRGCRRFTVILIYLVCWVSGSVAIPQEEDWSQRVDALLENSADDIVLTAVGDMIFNR